MIAPVSQRRRQPQASAADEYTRLVMQARDLVAALRARLEDVPAPEEHAIQWGHVGNMSEVVKHLNAAIDWAR